MTDWADKKAREFFGGLLRDYQARFGRWTNTTPSPTVSDVAAAFREVDRDGYERGYDDGAGTLCEQVRRRECLAKLRALAERWIAEHKDAAPYVSYSEATHEGAYEVLEILDALEKT